MQGFQVTPELEDELASMEIYQEELSWRTFIPPLTEHAVSRRVYRFTKLVTFLSYAPEKNPLNH